MALRDKIIEFTISQFEGGKVNDKADKGGITNFGITKPFLAWYNGCKPENINNDEINDLTKAEALTIYDWAWDQYAVDNLPDSVEHVFWDCCINHGRGNAVKIIQRALTLLGYNVGAIDGKMGMVTLNALYEADTKNSKSLMLSIVSARLSFYKLIVDRDPTQKKFIKGWTARCNWFAEHSIC